MKLTARYFINQAAGESDALDGYAYVEPDSELLKAVERQEVKAKAEALEAARIEAALRQSVPKDAPK